MYQDAVRKLFRNFESDQVPNIASLLAKPVSCKTQVVATQVVATQGRVPQRERPLAVKDGA